MFGIPSVERKIFERNFLKTAIFSLNYSTQFKIVGLKKDIQNLFEDFDLSELTRGVGLQLRIVDGKQVVESIEGSNEITGFELKSINGDLIITIQHGHVSLRINSDEYKNFDSITKYVPQIKQLLNLVHIKNYDNLSIRKINVLELEKTESITGPSQILLKSFINKRLFGDLSYFGKDDFVTSNISSIIFKEDNYNLNLRYGINSPNKVNENIKHILIDIESSVKGKLELASLNDEMISINQSIYDCFNWVIGDTFKQILNGEQIN